LNLRCRDGGKCEARVTIRAVKCRNTALASSSRASHSIHKVLGKGDTATTSATATMTIPAEQPIVSAVATTASNADKRWGNGTDDCSTTSTSATAAFDDARATRSIYAADIDGASALYRVELNVNNATACSSAAEVTAATVGLARTSATTYVSSIGGDAIGRDAANSAKISSASKSEPCHQRRLSRRHHHQRCASCRRRMLFLVLLCTSRRLGSRRRSQW